MRRQGRILGLVPLDEIVDSLAAVVDLKPEDDDDARSRLKRRQRMTATA